MSKVSTKDKILEVAHKLFSDKGINGVSVRELAKLCDCNIASINYYFKNKESLYYETVKLSIEQTESDIKDLYESADDKTIEGFSLAVFRLFVANVEDLRTAFKLLLSANKFNGDLNLQTKVRQGPPGSEFFRKTIYGEFPNADEKSVEWAIRILFTQVIHKSLIACNESFCSALKELEGGNIFEDDLIRLVTMVKKELE